MNKADILARYWSTSWEAVKLLQDKFGSTMDSGMCISKKTAELLGVGKESPFITVALPKIYTVYMRESGDIITNKTLTAEEFNEALESGVIKQVRICNEDTKDIDVTVVYDDIDTVIQRVTVDVNKALEEFSWLIKILTGRESMSTADLESASDEELEVAMTAVRTYAIKCGAVASFARGRTSADKESLVAILNANFMRSLIK